MLAPAALAEEAASQPSARLIVLIETEPYHSFLGDLYGSVYYQTPEVECWLDGQQLYNGPVHKPGTITKIYDGPVESGEHLLKLRWQARLRAIEGYRWDRQDGQQRVAVPEEGFEEVAIALPPGSTRVLKATVRREAGLKRPQDELVIEDVTEQLTGGAR